MADEIDVEQAKTMGGSLKALEERLRTVMKERSTIEAEIGDAKEHERLLHERASEIYAKEGTLRKQIGDLRSALEAAEE